LYETPASLACVYGLVTVTSGCNPNVVTTNPIGGSNAIAIVDAYDYSPYASSDLASFDAQFGVAAANFTVIYGTGNPSAGCQSGSQPPSASGTGWDLEEALDIEWAHAMAPSAKLYLVEANSSSYSDLLNAEQVAAKCVEANKSGQVSNSWGGSEFSGETSSDSVFAGSYVEYFAAAGDAPGVMWPAASPNVIGVGGTAISRNQVTGNFQSQATWENEDLYLYTGDLLGTGGGPSAYEARPGFQAGVASVVGTARGTPDVGAIADPATGVWVYNTTSCGGWCSVGGTSVATPVEAGLFNKAGYFHSSTQLVLQYLYGNAASVRTNDVIPVLNGNCGPGGYTTSGGYYAYGEPYDPTWTDDTTGIAYGMCTGWGTFR